MAVSQFKLQLPTDTRMRERILRFLSRFSPVLEGETVTALVPSAVASSLGASFTNAFPPQTLGEFDGVCDNCWEAPSAGGCHGYQSIGDDLRAFAIEHSDRAQRLTIGKSAEGREIWALRISPPSGRATKKLLLVGCHHACEWISVEVPLQLAKAAYIAPTTSDAEFFQDVELWAVPMLNVDGHYFSENYSRIWRKSRRAFVDPFGVACFGVDLNRNYPLGFGGGMSGTSDASIETFSGPKAFSEPETRALRDLCCREHFSGVLSFHAYGNEILYPWAYLPPDADSRETSEARSVALAMGAVMMHKGGAAYTVLQSYNHYDVGVGGDFCDWVFGEFGKIALTIELGPPDFEMQLPSPMIGSVVNEFWPGFLKFVEAAK